MTTCFIEYNLCPQRNFQSELRIPQANDFFWSEKLYRYVLGKSVMQLWAIQISKEISALGLYSTSELLHMVIRLYIRPTKRRGGLIKKWPLAIALWSRLNYIFENVKWHYRIQGHGLIPGVLRYKRLLDNSELTLVIVFVFFSLLFLRFPCL